MSVPVAFNDIGKPAKDLLTKDYPVGGVKLEVKTTAPNGVTFKVNGQRDNKTGIIVGDLETKYADKAKGITFTEAWTTSNHLNGKIELENNLAKGLKLELLTSLLPSVNEKAAKINATYKKPNSHTVATLDIFKTHFSVNSVVGQQGFLVGGEVAYNVLDGKISRYNAAIGYSAREYGVAIHATNNLSHYAASYYHRVNSDLEASGKAAWDSNGSNAVALEVGAKLQLDPSAFVKGKISNSGVLGVAYTQALRPGVKINLGASIDTTRLNENAHKLGLSFTLEN
ncbi:eukaryotic porin/Tom40 [Radiomyces spectabilis]|uniref:eukaryotic porin/Tom40 n=1 Tax=Radiomyces spectabilis TaxID=64574 RepID=UPI00221E7D4B|nr:eukaryotic porin/Tom40 [Radiomyces spectabilis]KAI8381543.1 eukaryotic porin/Tom40 [Radiomyces spectabilis]